MEKLSEWDPLAISSIQFNIKSINKYTSIATILISISIIAFSILININSISHLWIPSNQLPIYSIVQTYSKYPQSKANPLCITSPVPFLFTPILTYMAQKGQVLQRKPLVGYAQYTQMQRYVKGKYFICFDLQGMFLTRQTDRIRVELPPSMALYSYQIHLKTTSLSQIINNKPAQVVSYPYSGLIHHVGIFFANFIQVSLNDRLLINYQPKLIKGFVNPQFQTSLYSQSGQNGKAFFQIRNNFYRKYTSNVYKYTIKRQNIGAIISQILAWIGLITIPIAFIFIFLPFLQSFLKFDLIKARYTCPQLNDIDFSIWRDIKRKMTSICNFQRERVVNFAIESIQNELDILQILRKQVMMKQRISQVEYFEKSKDIFSCEFEHTESPELLQIEAIGSIREIEEKEQYYFDFKEEQSQIGIITKLQQIAKIFDQTQTPIQILSNNGKGYGSIWNIIALLLMSGALLFLLIFLGLFNVSAVYETQTCILADQQDFYLTIKKEQFLFRPMLEIAPRIPNGIYFSAKLVDKDKNIIKNLEIQSGDECGFPVFQNNYEWFCLKQDAKIQIAQENNTYLHLNIETSSTNRFDQMFINAITMQFYLQQLNYQSQDRYIWRSDSLKRMQPNKIILKKILAIQNEKQEEGFGLFDTQAQDLDFQGIYIGGVDRYNFVKKQDASYWQMLDNAWGLIILSFQLLIYRISHLINARIKKSRIDPLKEQKRSDILSILNDIDRFEKGIYKNQLYSIPHFFKQKMSQNNGFSSEV